MSRPHALKRFVAAAVLFSLCSALCLSNNTTRVRAENNNLHFQRLRSLLTCASSSCQETAVHA